MTLYQNHDFLKYLHEYMMSELNYRRNREFSIFGWSNAILLGITGSIYYSMFNKKIITSPFDFEYATMVSIAVLSITIFSIKWQLYQRRKAATHQQISVAILDQLGYFNHQPTILPEDWKMWGQKNIKYHELILVPSRISATSLSCVFALISLWFRYFKII